MVTMTSSMRHKDANGNDWSVVSTCDKSKLKLLSRQPAGGGSKPGELVTELVMELVTEMVM